MKRTTQAVEEAAAAWAEESGNTVEVTVASDMGQELAQGFAGGEPADVFYLDAGAFATNAEAFGVMPSRQSASADYTEAYPEDAAFIAGGDYGHGPINVPGIADVVADLNSQLEAIGDADLESVVESFDSNAESVLGR